MGEVVRRITGMKLGEFFRKEIAEPFDIDFHIGLSKDDFGRVATLTPPPPSGELRALGREHPAIKTFTGPSSSPNMQHCLNGGRLTSRPQTATEMHEVLLRLRA